MADSQSTTLEQELGELLDQERFDPPEDFVADGADHRPLRAREGGRGLRRAGGPSRPGRCTGSRTSSEVLDDSDPPFYKWFKDGKLNASYNCLDRHVEAGLGERVAFHWRGEEGEERDVTYAELLRDVKRFANALKDHGIEAGDVVGIYLPMIPEVVVAMLACARIGAPHNVVFGGFSAESVKERMEFSDAKALVTVDGARRKGKTAPIKQAVDEVMGDLDDLETIFVVKHTGEDCRDEGRARRLVPRGARGGRRRVRGRARWTPSTRSTSSTRRARRPSRRASCTPPAAT